jgi:nucleoside 2-deoxyribosyltransferase
MKIYLAGPDVFESNPVARGLELKAACTRVGAEGLFPLDNVLADGPDMALRIRDANMGMIRASDAVVANMTPFRGPSMDPGTAYEMGVAAGLGKIVVGYTRDLRPYVDKVRALVVPAVVRAADGVWRDGDGMLVEDFSLHGKGLVDNLMIAAGVEVLCETAEEAIRAATELFQKERSRQDKAA